MVERLGMRRASGCLLSSLEPVSDGGFDKAGLREVVRDDFRLARDDVDKPLLKCARDLAVQLLPAALEHALIRRIPHPRVLEAVDSVRRLATATHEFRPLAWGECVPHCG